MELLAVEVEVEGVVEVEVVEVVEVVYGVDNQCVGLLSAEV